MWGTHAYRAYTHAPPPIHDTTRPATRARPIPLATVELQKKASRYFHMGSDTTMKLAEELYNAGCVRFFLWCLRVLLFSSFITPGALS